MLRFRQFSLRSVFIGIFWFAVTLALLRLLPFLTPKRLVEMLGIDDSQRAPFLLLIPAALLVVAAATCGAALGVFVEAGSYWAIRLASLAVVTVLIYFVVMAWTIWSDHFLTVVYTAAVGIVCWRMLRMNRRTKAGEPANGSE